MNTYEIILINNNTLERKKVCAEDIVVAIQNNFSYYTNIISVKLLPENFS